MNRRKLQFLAKTRLQDAKVLLGRKRWSAAYCLCGYAIECAFKARLLRHIGESDALYGDSGFRKKVNEFWTHDLGTLLSSGGLEAEFGAARGADPMLDGFWSVTVQWKETSRYEEKSESEAKTLFQAVSDSAGVFQWFLNRW